MAAVLIVSSRDDASVGAGSAASPAPSQASQSPAAVAVTTEEIYHTSPWEYDVTYDNGNRILGSLELIGPTIIRTARPPARPPWCARR